MRLPQQTEPGVVFHAPPGGKVHGRVFTLAVIPTPPLSKHEGIGFSLFNGRFLLGLERVFSTLVPFDKGVVSRTCTGISLDLTSFGGCLDDSLDLAGVIALVGYAQPFINWLYVPFASRDAVLPTR